MNRIDCVANELEDLKSKVLKEGDVFTESQLDMQISDIVNTETIKRVRAELQDLESKAEEVAREKQTIVGKLTQAQDIVNLTHSNLEAAIRHLFKANNISTVASDCTHSSSPSRDLVPGFHRALPVRAKVRSPTPTELERRQTQQKIWDLSELVAALEGRMNDWSSIREEQLDEFL